MKTVINIVLTACIVVLAYICVQSIMAPINFEKAQKIREKAVITRLIDIRTAQVEYRKIHNHYTNCFDSLVTFVKEGKIPFMLKEGELTDKQREAGMTEKKAMKLIAKAKKTGNWRQVKKEGLEGFKREITYINVMDTLFRRANFTADSLRFVPNTTDTFELASKVDTTKSGAPLPLFVAKTHFRVFLKGLDKQEIINLIDLKKKLDKYPGLKVGDIEIPNNNAGNWE
jgi:hypothetical protein